MDFLSKKSSRRSLSGKQPDDLGDRRIMHTHSARDVHRSVTTATTHPIAVLGMQPGDLDHLRPNSGSSAGGPSGVGLGLREGSVSGMPNYSQRRNHNKLFPLYVNGVAKHYFRIGSARDYAGVLRRLLRRDPLLTFALQKAIKHLSAGEGRSVSHVTSDPTAASAALYGLRITPCSWADPAGGGAHVPALLLEHNVPYDPQDVMPRLLRDYAVLSHVPSILTLIDFNGVVLYQNASSLDYMGDLTSHSVAQRTAVVDASHRSERLNSAGSAVSGMLDVLFQNNPAMLNEMLQDVVEGNYWQAVVQVPPSLKRHLLFEDSIKQLARLGGGQQGSPNSAGSRTIHMATGAGSLKPTKANPKAAVSRRFVADMDQPEFQLDSFTTTAARDKRGANTPNRRGGGSGILSAHPSLAARGPAGDPVPRASLNGGPVGHVSQNGSPRSGSSNTAAGFSRGLMALATASGASGLSSKSRDSQTSVPVTVSRTVGADSQAVGMLMQARQSAPSMLTGSAAQASTHVMFTLPNQVAESAPSGTAGERVNSSFSNLQIGNSGKGGPANRRFMALMQGGGGASQASNKPEISFTASVGSGESSVKDDPRVAMEGDCWHEISAIPLLDPVLDKQVILLLQTNVTARVELENRLADLTDAQLSMLEQLFPRHVIEYMLSNKHAYNSRNLTHLAHQHDNVVVLFTDVVGFTTMSKEVQPSQVMNFLNELYTVFDDLVDEFDLYKLDTVGDCYIIVAGMTSQDDDGFMCVGQGADNCRDTLVANAQSMMDCAKAMLRESKQVLYPHNMEPAQIRIGIHAGSLASGLVGPKMPKFTLFGDTMNTASRMESTCQQGCVQVSDVVAELLPSEKWQDTGGVEVKGKGHMQTFLWVPTPADLIPSGSRPGEDEREAAAYAACDDAPLTLPVLPCGTSDAPAACGQRSSSEAGEGGEGPLPGSRQPQISYGSVTSVRSRTGPMLIKHSSSKESSRLGQLQSVGGQQQQPAAAPRAHFKLDAAALERLSTQVLTGTPSGQRTIRPMPRARSRPTTASTIRSLGHMRSFTKRSFNGRTSHAGGANDGMLPLLQILSAIRGDGPTDSPGAGPCASSGGAGGNGTGHGGGSRSNSESGHGGAGLEGPAFSDEDEDYGEEDHVLVLDDTLEADADAVVSRQASSHHCMHTSIAGLLSPKASSAREQERHSSNGNGVLGSIRRSVDGLAKR